MPAWLKHATCIYSLMWDRYIFMNISLVESSGADLKPYTIQAFTGRQAQPSMASTAVCMAWCWGNSAIQASLLVWLRLSGQGVFHIPFEERVGLCQVQFQHSLRDPGLMASSGQP